MRPKAPADPETTARFEQRRTVSGRSVLLIAGVAAAFVLAMLAVSYLVPALRALA